MAKLTIKITHTGEEFEIEDVDLSKRIPFEGFDFYDLFRVTFENSELGRMKRNKL